MHQPARPATPSARPTDHPGCPECGSPVAGIATTEPGVHRFVGCGHRTSARALRTLAGR